MDARCQYLKVLQERYFMTKSKKEKSSILDEVLREHSSKQKVCHQEDKLIVSLITQEEEKKAGLRWPCKDSPGKGLGNI